ncbi:MAG: hypothetical protein DI547_14460 [Sphingobium sp.]|nr:MAG: hypothetical protein DI547_14460 [Sphingobium sp.]
MCHYPRPYDWQGGQLWVLAPYIRQPCDCSIADMPLARVCHPACISATLLAISQNKKWQLEMQFRAASNSVELPICALHFMGDARFAIC